MTNIGVMLTGANNHKVKDPYNYYPTVDDEVVKALIRRYKGILEKYTILEPACGEGHMVRAICEETGRPVLATDIYHRGFGMGGISFTDMQPHPVFKNLAVITNPPFDFAEQFIRHGHHLSVPFFALFLKSQYWNAKSRLKLWKDHPPKACLPLSWRVDFTGEGNPTMDCQWVVWGDEVPFSNQPLEK